MSLRGGLAGFKSQARPSVALCLRDNLHQDVKLPAAAPETFLSASCRDDHGLAL